MIVRYHIPNPAQTALLQLCKHLAPAGLRLRLGHPRTKHLAVSVLADPHRHQNPLTHHLAGSPNSLITRVDHQVRIGLAQWPQTPRAQLLVKLVRQRRHLAPAHLQAAQRLGNRTHLPRRYALDIHLKHRQHKRLLAALVTLEQLRLELPFPILRNKQIKLAHTRLKNPWLVSVTPAPALRITLIRPGAKEAAHLRFQYLLNHSLNNTAKKVRTTGRSLPPVQNLNTLSIASHRFNPPLVCRSPKQHPKEKKSWLAHSNHSTLLQNFKDSIQTGKNFN